MDYETQLREAITVTRNTFSTFAEREVAAHRIDTILETDADNGGDLYSKFYDIDEEIRLALYPGES